MALMTTSRTSTPSAPGTDAGRFHRHRRYRAAATVIGAAVLVSMAGTPAAAASGHHQRDHRHSFEQVNLVSDLPGLAPLKDDNVRNPWGIAFGPTTPLWVNNQFSNTITLYQGAHGNVPFTKLGLTVKASSPTGIVFNNTGTFKVKQGKVSASANFLFNEFVTPAQGPPVGEISGWSKAFADPTATAVKATKVGAFYGGLALVPGNKYRCPRLLAADSQNGTVDVYDSKFHLVKPGYGRFVDPTRNPTPIAPYNVAYLGGRVYVAYAPAPGHEGKSALSVFSADGKFIKRLVTGGPLAGPWGMAIAPHGWNGFGGALLVGNVDDGKINAFNPYSGRLLGTLSDQHGHPLVNPGLWGIEFGNGVIGTPRTLIFAAGVGKETGNEVYEHGLVGLIKAAHDDDGYDD